MLQYIGARYVPRFMGTFDNTQVYEALDVVDNGLGTSYIAKIPVPAGTPLTNTTYWTIYGASSGAIINLQNQIGDLSSLTTTDQDNLTDAINEVDANTDEVASKIFDAASLAFFKNKTICIVGDSISDETTQQPNWVDAFTSIVSTVNATVNNVSVSGSSLVGWGSDPTAIPQGADIYIVALGINDFQGQFTQTAIINAVQAITSRIDLTEPTRRAFYISPLKAFIPTFSNMYTPQTAYRHLFEVLFAKYGYQVISGALFPNLSNMTNGVYIAADNIHPASVYRTIYAEHVIKCMLSGSSETGEGYGYNKTCDISSSLTYGSGNVALEWVDATNYKFKFNLFNVDLTGGVWTPICKVSASPGEGLIGNEMNEYTTTNYLGNIFQWRVNDGYIEVVPPTTGTYNLVDQLTGKMNIAPSMV